MPQIGLLIGLLGLLGVARFDRYSVDPASGVATITWDLLSAPQPPSPELTLANLLASFATLLGTTTVASVSVGANGVPRIGLRTAPMG